MEQASNKKLICDNLRVLAMTDPEATKLLVQLLKEKDRVVAVTGSRSQDLPALLEADIGLSLGKQGTDIIKNESSISLMEDTLSSILYPVMYGRNIYRSVKKFLGFLITSTIDVLLISLLATLLLFQPPFSAI